MKALQQFVSGYLECAPWASGEEFDGLPLSPEAIAALTAEAGIFYQENLEALTQATSENGYTWSHAGHDLWLTQNGHGAGYWDGDLPEELGDTLTKAASLVGCHYLELGDDGLIYLM